MAGCARHVFPARVPCCDLAFCQPLLCVVALCGLSVTWRPVVPRGALSAWLVLSAPCCRPSARLSCSVFGRGVHSTHPASFWRHTVGIISSITHCNWSQAPVGVCWPSILRMLLMHTLQHSPPRFLQGSLMPHGARVVLHGQCLEWVQCCLWLGTAVHFIGRVWPLRPGIACWHISYFRMD